MHILISNDDGYSAKGLAALNEAMIQVAETTVVAPERNRSGASNSLTLTRPLRVAEAPNGFRFVDGTPTDCVHVALTGLLDAEPDMVCSGINHGANLGDDVLYSGTVAAAMEGRHLGLPAIAISLAGSDLSNFDSAGAVALGLVKRLQSHPLPKDTILNVNVPDLPINEIKGFCRHVLVTDINLNLLFGHRTLLGGRFFGSDRPGKKKIAGRELISTRYAKDMCR